MSAHARIKRLLETCPDASSELVASIVRCPKKLVQSVRWRITNEDLARERNKLLMRKKRAEKKAEARP